MVTNTGGNGNLIAVLGDEDTVTGFRLAGVQHSFQVNLSSKDAVEEIRAAADRALEAYSKSGSGLLIVTEAIYELMEKHNITVQFQKYPEITLVQIPDKNGSKGIARQKLAKLFENAIGVAMKK